MWADLENYSRNEVPICLKVLLWKCGYDTILSLKYINEESIAEIEEHVQKYKEKILFDESDMSEYLDDYKKQNIFKFLPGHRSILLDLLQSISGMQSQNALHCHNNTNMMTNAESSNDEMTTEYSVILNELINTARRNKNKSKNAYQYDDTVKHFSTYIFLLCGRTCYETLSKNLPMPSTKTIR